MDWMESSDVWTPPFCDVKDEDYEVFSDVCRMSLRSLIDSHTYSDNRELHEALYNVNLTDEEVTDALLYASQKRNIACVQAIVEHPFYKVTLRPSPAQTRSLWSGAVRDDPSSLSTTLAQHTFSAEELRDVLLEAGRHRAYRFLDQYVRHPKVCVDVHSASGENILNVLLHQLQKNKSHEDDVLNLVNAIGEKVKEEQAEDVDPTTKQQRLASKNVVAAWQRMNDEHDSKYKQPKCIFAKLGDPNSPLHLAVKCGSLPILKSLMKYRNDIIRTPILDECPSIDLISTALQGKNVPLICFILSNATCFFDENSKQHYDYGYGSYHSSVAQRICDQYTGFKEEEKSAMLECVVASASATNKLASSFTAEIFKHGQQSCLKALIEQKFSNVVAPKPQESHSFQYLLKMAYNGKLENLKLLLAHRHDLNIDINEPTISTSSLLDLNEVSHELSKLVRLCHEKMFDVKLTLLQVSMRTGKVGVLETLLDKGADTTSKDPFIIPLICHNMYYTSYDCLKCVKMLLRDGCDLDQTFVLRDKGFLHVTVSLLDYYLICSDIFMVKMLFDLGASKFSLETDRGNFKEADTLQIHHLKSKVSSLEMEKVKDELVGEVHTLYKLCRNVVRKSLCSNVEEKIYSLILPLATKEFLNLEELDDMQEKYDKFMETYKNKRRMSISDCNNDDDGDDENNSDDYMFYDEDDDDDDPYGSDFYADSYDSTEGYFLY